MDVSRYLGPQPHPAAGGEVDEELLDETYDDLVEGKDAEDDL